MENSQSLSDLIYLFLDGENTPTEKTVLFSALANSSELQTEFEDALRIRGAITQEIRTSAPPAALTGALFSRAGFVPPMSAGVAESAASTTGFFSKFVESWGLSTLMFAVPALTAIGGFALAFFLSEQQYSGEMASLEQRVQQLQAQQSQTQEQLTNVLNSRTNENATQNVLEPNTTTTTQWLASEPTRMQLRPTPFLSTNNSFNSTSDSPKQTQPTQLPQATELFISQTSTPIQQAPQVIASNRQPESTGATIVQPRSIPVDVPVLTNSSSSFLLETSEPSPMYLQARGLAFNTLVNNVSGFQQSNAPVNNVSVGVGYNISENFSTTIDGGIEQYPLFTQTNAAPTAQSVVWGTLGARYALSELSSSLPIQPYAHLSAGVGTIGPMLRGSVGAGWNADSHIQFFAALERSQMWSLSNSSTATKFNMNYGVAVRF